uniref:Uncharacterized protein n=1 Tax=Parastrongyloides trichosuri TaxID=131310 RepID=A0A0N4Z923_PARTI
MFNDYNDDASDEEEIIEVNENETCQNWILRYLKSYFANIDEEILTEFVQQKDITPVRNFIFNFMPMTAIFIKVIRHRKIIELPPIQEIPVEKKEISTKVTDKKKNKHTYSMKAHKKKRKKEKKKVKKEKVVENPILPEKEEEDLPEIILEWSVEKIIPKEEFILITVKNLAKPSDTELDEESEESFDNNFFIGHIGNTNKINLLFDIGEMLLGNDFNFNSKMELLMRFLSITSTCSSTDYQKWNVDIDQLMDFIYDCIVKSFTRTLSFEILSDFIMVESIEELLKSRINDFVQNPLPNNRNQILMELSLFELKYISSNVSLPVAVEDLNRILKTLLILNVLYTDEKSSQWYCKIFFRLIEISCSLYGDFLKAKCKWMIIDIEEVRPKRINVQEILFNFMKEIVDLTIDYAVKETEQHVWMEKIKSCLKIMIVLEEELDELLEIADFISDERWDIVDDRSTINKCIDEFMRIWKIVEDSCIESAFESGNNESLKSLCYDLMMEAENVREIIKIGFVKKKFT